MSEISLLTLPKKQRNKREDNILNLSYTLVKKKQDAL